MSWLTGCSLLVWIRDTCNQLVRSRHIYIQFGADTLVISWLWADLPAAVSWVIRHTCNQLVWSRHIYIQFGADTLVISWLWAYLPAAVSWCGSDTLEISWWGADTSIFNWSRHTCFQPVSSWSTRYRQLVWIRHTCNQLVSRHVYIQFEADTLVISWLWAVLPVAVSWCGSDTLAISWWGADTSTFNLKQTHLLSCGEENTY
jgi:hypothetical protein